MRKTTLIILVILVMLAVSLPARAPSLSSERPSTPPVPLSVTGTVQYNGFNLKTCDGSAGECLDLVAVCGTFTDKGITIFLENGKSYYSADVPGDMLETQGIVEGCTTGELVTFILKGEVPPQTPIEWTGSSLPISGHNLAIGSPSMVFLPMIHR